MKYTRWNIRYAKHQIRKLQQNNQNGKYDIDIAKLKQIIENSIVPFEHELTLREKLIYDKEKLNEYSYFLKDIKDFTSFNFISKEHTLETLDMPISELLVFTNDYIKKVFPSWYNIFNKIYKEKHRNLQVGGERSYELYIQGLNYSYINLSRELTIEDFYSIIHEYIHAIVDSLKYRHTYDNRYPFVELPSLTAELIASDILKEVYTNINGEVKKYELSSLIFQQRIANNILVSNNFIIANNLDASEEEILYSIKKYSFGNTKKTNNLTSKLLLENINYVVPFLYGVELYYLYLFDPELFQYTMDSIIMMEEKYNYQEEMKKLDLIPNRNMNYYIDRIKRG